jgi:hypothetical protein
VDGKEDESTNKEKKIAINKGHVTASVSTQAHVKHVSVV